MARVVKTPGPDHPITIRPAGRAVRAVCAGHLVAQSARALVLAEAHLPHVTYFPREDVDLSMLERSASSSWCPYKGEASYFSLCADARIPDVAWSYEAPLPAMKEIAGHVAFYANRTSVEDA